MVTSQLNSTSATSSTCGWSDHTLFCHSSCVGLYQFTTISGCYYVRLGFSAIWKSWSIELLFLKLLLFSYFFLYFSYFSPTFVIHNSYFSYFINVRLGWEPCNCVFVLSSCRCCAWRLPWDTSTWRRTSLSVTWTCPLTSSSRCSRRTGRTCAPSTSRAPWAPPSACTKLIKYSHTLSCLFSFKKFKAFIL